MLQSQQGQGVCKGAVTEDKGKENTRQTEPADEPAVSEDGRDEDSYRTARRGGCVTQDHRNTEHVQTQDI